MKRNTFLLTAACFLIAAFFIITSNHVRVEQENAPVYSKNVTQVFSWKMKERFPTIHKPDKNFFSFFSR
jgi:hypothetical protein